MSITPHITNIPRPIQIPYGYLPTGRITLDAPVFGTCNGISKVELEDRLWLGYLFLLGLGLRSSEELVALEFMGLLPGEPTEIVVVSYLVFLV